jgi:hypothetical protein
MFAIVHARRAALVAVAALAVHAASASAIKLALGESGFRVAWTAMRFTASGFSVSCNLTLEGSFHSRTLSKVERALVGHVARASVGGCSGGNATLLTETLPWHVQYGSFAGTLPNITSVSLRVIGASVRVSFREFGELACLARTEANSPGVVIASRNEAGNIASMRLDETAGISMTGEGCGLLSRGRLVGTSTAVTTPGGGAISLRLIGEEPSLSPTPVEFGVVATEAVVSRSVTIRAGTDPLEVRSIALGSGASFAVLDPNRCVGSRLSERGTCVFRAIFAAPRETGRAFEDTITVGTSVRTLEAVVRATT